MRLNRFVDPRILIVAVNEQRIVLTNNRRDFILLHGAWVHLAHYWNISAEHHGILLLEQRNAVEVTARDVLALQQGEPSVRNRLFLWSRAGWRELFA